MAGRPGLLRLHRRPPPAAAELQLVRAGEIAAVPAEVVLRTRALILVIRVVGDAAVVDEVVGGEAAGRRQQKTGVDVRAPRRREQLLADNEVPLALVVARRSGLIPRRLGGAGRAGVSAGLGLVVFVKGEVTADVVVQLAVGLQRVVTEMRVVGRSRQREQIDRGVGHRAPDPHDVLQQRAAELEPVVLVLVGAIAFAGDVAEGIGQRLGKVDVLQLLVLEVIPQAAVRCVEPLLQHHVELHAGRRVLRISAARRDRHLLEAVEVVVKRGRPCGAIRPDDAVAHVGDGNPVEVPGVVGGLRALGVVVGLLPGFRAADVDAIQVDRRHRLQHDPRVARTRRVLQFLDGDVRRGRRALQVDRRRDRGDVDDLGRAGNGHRHDQRRARAAEHFDVAVGRGRESGE